MHVLWLCRYLAGWLVLVAGCALAAYYISTFPNRRREARTQARMRLLLKHRVLSRDGGDTSAVGSSMLRRVLLPDSAVVSKTDLFGPSARTASQSPSNSSSDDEDISASSAVAVDIENLDLGMGKGRRKTTVVFSRECIV